MTQTPVPPEPTPDSPAGLEPPERRWMLYVIAGILVGGLLLMQIFPLMADYTNPSVVDEPPWDSPETRELAKRACFDCHSNETEWPWYSYIAPFSEVQRNHVIKGREVLNFSEWTGQEQAAAEEAIETISKGQMPLPYYVILHPEADLSDAEKGALINGLIATYGDPSLDADELDEAPDAPSDD